MVLSHESNYFGMSIETTQLYKAKSLFKLFKRQQCILKQCVFEEKNFRIKHGSTYSLAKEAIILFDKAAVLDEESSHMFDIAMMEYAAETNNLREIRRCLLCRSKATLLRSHMCPHSILREFCSGLTVPENLRVFDTSMDQIGHSKSPKEVTMFAFCKSCENNLNVNGEQDFLPHFFRKVYSRSNVAAQSEGKSIAYGTWLYHFCVGMLFRAFIRQKFDRYFNSQEIYDFFLECRKILLNPSSQNTVPTQVYLMIGPCKARDEDSGYGFVNEVLNDAYFCVISASKEPPYPARFIVVHVGVMYIVKIFSSSMYHLSDEYKVNPLGGVYHVPPEKKRSENFTTDLWKLVQLVALERSKGWLERPLAPLKRLQQAKMVESRPSLDALFHVSSSVEPDLNLFENSIVPSPDPNSPRIFSLLPPGFAFRPINNQSTIIVPEKHQILLHYCIENKECYFLAVGKGGAYSLFRPYVIYSHCEPGLQFSTGFFIDPKSLKFVEFLPSREGKAMLEKLSIVDKLRNEVQDTLAKCLKAKGVKNLCDVLHLLDIDDSK